MDYFFFIVCVKKKMHRRRTPQRIKDTTQFKHPKSGIAFVNVIDQPPRPRIDPYRLTKSECSPEKFKNLPVFVDHNEEEEPVGYVETSKITPDNNVSVKLHLNDRGHALVGVSDTESRGDLGPRHKFLSISYNCTDPNSSQYPGYILRELSITPNPLIKDCVMNFSGESNHLFLIAQQNIQEIKSMDTTGEQTHNPPVNMTGTGSSIDVQQKPSGAIAPTTSIGDLNSVFDPLKEQLEKEFDSNTNQKEYFIKTNMEWAEKMKEYEIRLARYDAIVKAEKETDIAEYEKMHEYIDDYDLDHWKDVITKAPDTSAYKKNFNTMIKQAKRIQELTQKIQPPTPETTKKIPQGTKPVEQDNKTGSSISKNQESQKMDTNKRKDRPDDTGLPNAKSQKGIGDKMDKLQQDIRMRLGQQPIAPPTWDRKAADFKQPTKNEKTLAFSDQNISEEMKNVPATFAKKLDEFMSRGKSRTYTLTGF